MLMMFSGGVVGDVWLEEEEYVVVVDEVVVVVEI
jgi:hypothetical protein